MLISDDGYQIHVAENPFQQHSPTPKISLNSEFRFPHTHSQKKKNQSKLRISDQAQKLQKPKKKLKSNVPVLRRQQRWEELPRETIPHRHGHPRRCMHVGSCWSDQSSSSSSPFWPEIKTKQVEWICRLVFFWIKNQSQRMVKWRMRIRREEITEKRFFGGDWGNVGRECSLSSHGCYFTLY